MAYVDGEVRDDGVGVDGGVADDEVDDVADDVVGNVAGEVVENVADDDVLHGTLEYFAQLVFQSGGEYMVEDSVEVVDNVLVEDNVVDGDEVGVAYGDDDGVNVLVPF